MEPDLRVCLEVLIDVCQRLLSLAGLPPAANGAEAVRACVQLGALLTEESYPRIIQFRSFMAHRCHQVDAAVLLDSVNQRLGDFDRLRDGVLRHVRR